MQAPPCALRERRPKGFTAPAAEPAVATNSFNLIARRFRPRSPNGLTSNWLSVMAVLVARRSGRCIVEKPNLSFGQPQI
jgi:hypothetical protein